MSDVVRFFVSCIPPTANHQRKRIVKIGKFSRLADAPQLVAAKGLLESLLIPHQISEPIPSPCALSLSFTWPWLSTHGKRIRMSGRIPHTSKPDCDNASKTFTDKLVDLRFIEDDRGIVFLQVEKWWGDRPGVEVVIAPFIRVDCPAPVRLEFPAPSDLFRSISLE